MAGIGVADWLLGFKSPWVGFRWVQIAMGEIYVTPQTPKGPKHEEYISKYLYIFFFG